MNKKLIVLGLVGLLIVVSGAATYFYLELSKLRRDPQQVVQTEVREVLAKVSRLLVLPEGETPTVATVADPDKLKGQPFFQNAKKGDKVLIFANAKKAVLYSPVDDKIIDIAPLNFGAPENGEENR